MLLGEPNWTGVPEGEYPEGLEDYKTIPMICILNLYVYKQEAINDISKPCTVSALVNWGMAKAACS